MKIITLDLEMDQPSGKIIQLGYVISEPKTKKRILERRIYINPNDPLSPFIIALTGITQSQINNYGISLPDAYEQLKYDVLKHQVFKVPCQWGTDHQVLRSQLEIPWEEFIFSSRCIDVKSLYQVYTMVTPQSKTIAGLAVAMSLLGLEFEGRQHDALNDAKNTLRIFEKLADNFTLACNILKSVSKISK